MKTVGFEANYFFAEKLTLMTTLNEYQTYNLEKDQYYLSVCTK